MSALLLGYGADLAFGDPRRGHPVAAFGSLAAALERRLWRPRRWAGALYAAVLVGGAAALVGAAERLAGRRLVGALTLWAALGGRSLAREAGAVADAVARGDLAGGRARIGALVSRDPEALDAAGLCRAATESVAENTVDAVVAPLLWWAVAGPAGVAAHRAANTLDAMVGYRTERHAEFGWAAARLDDVLNWPAARLGCALAVAAAPLAGGDARGALRAWRRDGAHHPSPNAGRVEATFAGALGLRLGGPAVRDGALDERPHLGDGRAPEPADVARAVRLSRLVGACALGVAALTGAARRRAARHGAAGEVPR